MAQTAQRTQTAERHRGAQRAPSSKISPHFATRLNSLSAEERVHAVLLLKIVFDGSRRGERRSAAERRALAGTVRSVADSALSAIDEILDRHDGERLAERANALGSLPVETTSSGILALAESGYVKAILEDQDISLLPSP